jgi:hypothetical protein
MEGYANHYSREATVDLPSKFARRCWSQSNYLAIKIPFQNTTGRTKKKNLESIGNARFELLKQITAKKSS